MAKIKVSKTRLLEAIRNAGGKWTGICEILNINRTTLARYINDDPEVAEACEFARDRVIERAEHKLSEAIERGEGWAIQLALKDSKRGKERGYGASVDVTSGGKTIEQPKEDNARFDRAIITLADAVREVVSSKSNGQNSEVDTAK